MLAFINRVVKECGQIKLGRKLGPYFNLMWENDEIGVVLEKFVGANGYGFKKLSDMGEGFVKSVYDDLKQDFELSDKSLKKWYESATFFCFC